MIEDVIKIYEKQKIYPEPSIILIGYAFPTLSGAKNLLLLILGLHIFFKIYQQTPNAKFCDKPNQSIVTHCNRQHQQTHHQYVMFSRKVPYVLKKVIHPISTSLISVPRYSYIGFKFRGIHNLIKKKSLDQCIYLDPSPFRHIS